MYWINGQQFNIKDLTLDEADEVNNLVGKQGANVELDNKGTKQFLSIVLDPTPNENDLKKCTESVALEVLQAFFTMRIKRSKNLTSYFKSLAQNTKK